MAQQAPGPGAFVMPGSLGMHPTSGALSAATVAPARPGPPKQSTALHPNQDRYRNLTVGQVATLQALSPHCVTAINFAVQRLARFLNLSNPEADRRIAWRKDPSHCWWGNFDGERIRRIHDRFVLIRGIFRDGDQLKFRLRNWGRAHVAPPYTRRVFLWPHFFTEYKWEMLDDLIHEVSHLSGMLNVERYGREKALALAARNPAGALRNSDNYAYFAQDSYLIRLGHKPGNDPGCQSCFVYPYPAGTFKGTATNKPFNSVPAWW